MIDFKEKYDEAFEAYRNKDYKKARELFEFLLRNDRKSYKALRMLVNIDINLKNFREAMEKIRNNMFYDDVNTLRLLSKIACFEYNYDALINQNHQIIEMSKIYSDKFFA
jgi:predicted Zn-dependent protease